MQAVEEPTENTQKQQDNITIDVKYARHIVGKEGKNLKTLKDKHNITITTSNDTNNNLILTVTGNPNNIHKALTEIRTIIEIQQESDKELENKKKQVQQQTMQRLQKHRLLCKRKIMLVLP